MGRHHVVALVLLLTAPTAAAGQELRSPTLHGLRTRAAAVDTLDTGAFWSAVARRGTPLVEPLPQGDSVLVTFLFRGAPTTDNVLVYGALTGWLPPANLMRRIAGTDVWHRTVASRSDVRFTYRLAENDALRTYWEDPTFARRVETFRPDPLNPDTVPVAGGRAGSYFVGPGFEPGPWSAVRAPDGGRLDTLALGDRTVRLYRPPDTEGDGELGLLLTMDGRAYDALVSTPATVERLVEAAAIPPTVVAMVEHLDRNRELPPNEPFVRFVADTLLPALEARFPLSADPGLRVVAGSSLGGLAAAYLGFRLPDRFGAVIAQSGAWWWSPPGDDEGGWVQRLFAGSEKRPLRIYLDAGSLETQPVRGGASILRLTQHVRDVLCGKGYEVAYRTFPGGHEYEHWRATLPGALVWALGDPAAPGPDGGTVVERDVGGAVCERLVPSGAPGPGVRRWPSPPPAPGVRR